MKGIKLDRPAFLDGLYRLECFIHVADAEVHGEVDNRILVKFKSEFTCQIQQNT
jgi:hypothetical protein